MQTVAYILLVDDEVDWLDTISLILETTGYRVLTAANGVEALAILQTQAVDLILSDVSMPQMNGYQLYKYVRQHSQWALIPFIFLTGQRTLNSDIRYGKKLRVDDYLTKPIHFENLLSTVGGKLKRARQLNAAGHTTL